MEPIVTDSPECARCGGRHDALVFQPLSRPILPRAGEHHEPITHWTPCPFTGEPVLLFVQGSQD